MEVKPQPEPNNLVEHMKLMMEPFGPCEEAVPDMLVEYFHQFVDQTLKYAHANAISTHFSSHTTIRRDDILIAGEVMSQNVQQQQQQIIDKAAKINKQSVASTITLEVVHPPKEVSLEETNFQISKRQKNAPMG